MAADEKGAKRAKGERFLDQAYSHSSVDETYAMYEAWADSYNDELNESGYQQPIRCAQALKAILPDAGRVFDVGCGTGLSGLALKAEGFAAIDGCDFSPAMLEKARQTGVYQKLFEVDLNQRTLDLETDTYDAATVVGVFSMQHVKVEAMDNLVRVVKPGGAMVIGINDTFYKQGALCAKLDALSALGLISQINHQHGEHIPEIGLSGWVITLKVLK